jgi:membrane protein implicated in regulation of membrane protease activity
MIEIITDPSFVWGLSGLILIAAEMLVPGFVIFFFGSGALLTALAAALFPPVGASFGLQGLIWGISSVVSLVFLRKRFSRIFRGTVLNRERVEDLGETAEVIERITPDEPGRVRYRGTSWKAVSYTETFEAGEKVSIVQEDGLTMVVSAPIVQDYGE